MFGTVFDRYLISRYFHVLAVFIVAVLGLVVVIDLLDNIDDFTTRTEGTQELFRAIAKYYFYMSFFIFERMGPAIGLIAFMVVLWMTQRSQELQVMLASGVPTIRLAIPLVVAVGIVCGLNIVNQELIIPRIAHKADEARGANAPTAHQAEAVYDHRTRVLINGKQIFLGKQLLVEPEFVLPAPELVGHLTGVKAKQAKYLPGDEGRPGGWLLLQPNLSYDELKLTENGKKVVRKVSGREDLFIVSEVSCSQLHKRDRSFTRMAIQDQIALLHSGTTSELIANRIRSHLNLRFTQLPAQLTASFLIVPLMLRREGRDAPLAFARSTVAVLIMFGLSQGGIYISQTGLVSCEVVAWIPIVLAAVAATWLFKDVAT
ncbi:LptF/LptG family permease [Calycomorphotria hydatis]|uniref:Putative permease YjgP/YjgQ family protein n=1 Tax=Calycomorphotria hydatis TaxID=2528027 RepID=A0A517T6D9_9PLAN|nr:LptF/LptG family permease [Calycomorphotria hydatis]QDT63918.1 putative permease YjgP/YjgQ family protein [Calycomorphotria hydatis]